MPAAEEPSVVTTQWDSSDSRAPSLPFLSVGGSLFNPHTMAGLGTSAGLSTIYHGTISSLGSCLPSGAQPVEQSHSTAVNASPPISFPNFLLFCAQKELDSEIGKDSFSLPDVISTFS